MITSEMPELWAQPVKIAGNIVRQLILPSMEVALEGVGGSGTGRYGSWPITAVASEEGPLSVLVVCL